ncbi:MAG: manganese efflux pump MntP family protein, partial [Clostridiales bacterium]|nr:manganese efflux pump MntP family protein [Clostridiales bacterium]
LLKLASGESDSAFADCNCNRRLSVPEGIALGAAISVDGLAAGFGYAADFITAAFSSAFTFAFSCAALYMGAKGGSGVHKGRRGNIAAGLVLVFLAAQKLWNG